MTKGPARSARTPSRASSRTSPPARCRSRSGLEGPSYCTTSACSSGAHAIGEASEWIRRGKADVMVAGGAEATITPVGIARLRGDVRAQPAQRRSGAREPPVRQGPRRLRLRRGRAASSCSSRSRARRSAARRSTPRSPATARRATPTTSRSPRPAAEGAQRAMRMALKDAQRRAGRSRLRQRARHLDARRRRRRVARDRRGLRRARDRQEALGELDQVDDGPPARRRRRGRDARSARSRSREGQRPADDQPRSTRIPSARSTTSPNTARERRVAPRDEQLVRLRRHELRAPAFPLRGVSAAPSPC